MNVKKMTLIFLAFIMLITHITSISVNASNKYYEDDFGHLISRIEYWTERSIIRRDGFDILSVFVVEHYYDGYKNTYSSHFRTIDILTEEESVQLDVGPFIVEVMIVDGEFGSMELIAVGEIDVDFTYSDVYLSNDDFELLINYLENYIEFAEGKIIVNESIKNSRMNLQETFLLEMLEGIENLNYLAKRGYLIIAENGTITETNLIDSNDRSGLNRRTWHWWGTRAYRNRANTNININNLRRFFRGSEIVWFVSSKFGFTPGVMGANAASLWSSQLANALTRHNGVRGTRTDQTWALFFTVRSQ